LLEIPANVFLIHAAIFPPRHEISVIVSFIGRFELANSMFLLRVRKHAWSALREFLAPKNDVKSNPP